MKKFKKIGAFVLVVVMMLALSVSAFAANMTGESGVIGEFETPDTPTAQGTSVIIYKEITAYNPEECTVNAPTVTYEYTIAAGSANKNIYDANSHHNPVANAHVLTKAGVGTPTITGTSAGTLALVPGTNTLNASANGTANRFPLTVSFEGITFPGAGVYRYVITETTTEAVKNAAGIAEGSGANTLYLDVYVDGDSSIYGYVLFTNDVDIDARENDDAAAATAAGKVEGFVDTDTSETVSTADGYYTFNLEIKKVVQNDTYIKTTHHQFPFTVTLANTSVTAAVLPIMTVSVNATQTALTAGAIAGTWNPTIADGASVKYVGIPCGTTVTVYETNDVAGTTYAASVTNADGTVETKNIYNGENSNTATINCGATALQAATENHTESASKVLTFTNTLLQISPTGVVMRVAPYVMILTAGIALLLVSKRGRREEA